MKQKNKKTVLSLGFGKAGSQLHLPNWIDAGFNIVAFIPDVEEFNSDRLQHLAKEAYDRGQLQVIHSLDNLAVQPTIVDIVSPSGLHIAAMKHYLEATADQAIALPQAWLIEKPVISDSQELLTLNKLIDTYGINQDNIFVNENYAASVAIEHIHNFIERQAEAGNQVKSIDVVFFKDRVPDVRRGRFTDSVLGAYGIEMHHQLAAAYRLAGIHGYNDTETIENIYHTKVNDVEHSEATYTHLRSLSGIDIRIAQGLGPFVIDAAGTITARENPRITRYVNVTFADRSIAKIYFDPAPNIERFYSIVTWIEDGKPHTLHLPDNTVKRVFASIVDYVDTGTREEFTEGLSLDSAVNYFTSLQKLRQTADVR